MTVDTHHELRLQELWHQTDRTMLGGKLRKAPRLRFGDPGVEGAAASMSVRPRDGAHTVVIDERFLTGDHPALTAAAIQAGVDHVHSELRWRHIADLVAHEQLHCYLAERGHLRTGGDGHGPHFTAVARALSHRIGLDPKQIAADADFRAWPYSFRTEVWWPNGMPTRW